MIIHGSSQAYSGNHAGNLIDVRNGSLLQHVACTTWAMFTPASSSYTYFVLLL